MSREPLLPSYASVTGNHDNTPAISLFQTVSTITFTTAAITSTVWVHRTNTTPQLTPPASAPLLPYFASLCLLASFSCWVGYLIFILHDVASGPKLHRKIVVWISVVGKLVLAGAHAGFWLEYHHFFVGSAQPNWALMFLAAQAWWDFLLLVLSSRLRRTRGSHARW
ncbi:hypothetical protein BDV28DRAFT_135157 [Aspergillus coremiiformis]|uniref:Uncharacterized protein n=1 Tax=Aspergillus coremiiformis TaxID=138285 RepID=A0A5N6Z6B4_9EURO|nr:hypothetical protein BDV28DRAFT_135157 [Aspergillus coremiiformis]